MDETTWARLCATTIPVNVWEYDWICVLDRDADREFIKALRRAAKRKPDQFSRSAGV